MLLQVKMWKDLEAEREKWDSDPARVAGSTVLELDGRHPGVQRLHALGAQLRAQSVPNGQGSGQDRGQESGQDGGQGSVPDLLLTVQQALGKHREAEDALEAAEGRSGGASEKGRAQSHSPACRPAPLTCMAGAYYMHLGLKQISELSQ